MTQQVNLYQAIFREVRPPLSLATIGGILALLAVLLGAGYGYLHWQAQQQRQAVAELEQQRAAARERLEQVIDEHPPPTKSEALQQRLDAAEADLARKRRVLETLGERAAGRRGGFSAHLEALARQRLDQLWLTEIRLYRGGREIELAGSTYAPEQVPQYLQRLSREARFDGVRFADLRMDRSEEEARRVDFRLHSRRTTEDDGDEGSP